MCSMMPSLSLRDAVGSARAFTIHGLFYRVTIGARHTHRHSRYSGGIGLCYLRVDRTVWEPA
jgi:hypothetical protein